MKFNRLFFRLAAAALTGSLAAALCGSAAAELGVRLAQEPNCNDPQTQAEMNACAGLLYESADKTLNEVYQQVRSKLRGANREKLTLAQRAWIEFREGNCEFAKSQVEGGTMAPAIRAGCLADITEKRAASLESYKRGELPQPEGRSYQEADRRLNEVYKQLRSKLAGARQTKLESAQLAWIKFRDQNCRFESTQARAGENLCLTRLTEQRTGELQNFLEMERL
ncbi:MAG: DUF1311 domain-containing protein [Oscillatoria princeps RMCB-10]|jgi:uncharacterized protein YecT (DUF1311 family)|nr:DUF1311 domain-containing protein [Oscillatoria princeps RMCB-10]